MTSGNVTINWNSSILKERGIKVLFSKAGVLPSGTNREVFSSNVETGTVTITDLKPSTRYSLGMAEGIWYSRYVDIGIIDSMPTGNY